MITVNNLTCASTPTLCSDVNDDVCPETAQDSFIRWFSHYGTVLVCLIASFYATKLDTWRTCCGKLKIWTDNTIAHCLKWSIVIALLDKFEASEILTIVKRMHECADDRSLHLTKDIVSHLIASDNSLNTKKELYGIILNDFLKSTPVLPIDPDKFLAFRSTCDPTMQILSSDIDPIQVAHVVVHLYKLCSELLNPQFISPHDDVSDLSDDDDSKRNSQLICCYCAKCRRTRHDYEACTSLVTYFAFCTFCNPR